MNPDLQAAVERLGSLSSESPTFRTWIRCGDLRLVLDALKEAERVADAGKRVATYFARSELDRVKSRVEAQQGRYPIYDALPDCLALENWRKPQ